MEGLIGTLVSKIFLGGVILGLLAREIGRLIVRPWWKRHPKPVQIILKVLDVMTDELRREYPYSQAAKKFDEIVDKLIEGVGLSDEERRMLYKAVTEHRKRLQNNEK